MPRFYDTDERQYASYEDQREARRNRSGAWSLLLIPVLLLMLGFGISYAWNSVFNNGANIGDNFNQRTDDASRIGIGGAPGATTPSVSPTISPTPRVGDTAVGTSMNQQSVTEVGIGGGGAPEGAPQTGLGGLAR